MTALRVALRQQIVEFDLDVDLLLVAPRLDQLLGLVDVGGERGEVGVGGARAGDAHDGRGEPQPRLGELVERHAAELVEVAEAVADQAGIALADEGAAARTRLQRNEAGALEIAQRLAHRAAADAEAFGQFALRRQLVARAQLARGDAYLDLRRDLVGQALALDRGEVLAHGAPSRRQAGERPGADAVAIGCPRRAAADVVGEIGVECRLVAAGGDIGLEVLSRPAS